MTAMKAMIDEEEPGEAVEQEGDADGAERRSSERVVAGAAEDGRRS